MFHLAAAVGVRHIVDDPLTSMLTNTRGTENVLDACFRYWRKVVARVDVGGLRQDHEGPDARGRRPGARPDDGRTGGRTRPPRRSTSTSRSRTRARSARRRSCATSTPTVPASTTRGYGSVVANFLRQATAGEPMTVHGDGRQSRCFTYIDDTVRGTVLAGFTPEAEGMVFNLGSTRETSIPSSREMIKRRGRLGLRDRTDDPYESYYGPGFEDTRRRVPDISRAREVLGLGARGRARGRAARAPSSGGRRTSRGATMADAYREQVDGRAITVGRGRARVRRPAARDRASPRPASRRSASTSTASVADALNRGQSHIDDVSTERVAAMVDAARFEATASTRAARPRRCGVHLRPDTVRQGARPRTCRTSARPRETVAEVLEPGMLVILQSTTYPGHDDRDRPAGPRGARAARRRRLPPRVLARARRSRQHARGRCTTRPRSSVGITPACTERARLLLESVHGRARPRADRREPGRGRDGQAAREHLPRGEHRARQRARDARARDGHRRLGGHRRGRRRKPFGFQAFYPGIGPGRALHPGRPVLPLVEGARVRLPDEVHRARGGRQLRHGALHHHARPCRVQRPRAVALHGARVLCLGAAFKRGRERHPELPRHPGDGAAPGRRARWSSSPIRS